MYKGIHGRAHIFARLSILDTEPKKFPRTHVATDLSYTHATTDIRHLLFGDI
jgi:hypothetical protein